MATPEQDEPRGPFLCHGFFVYRMASGWAVLTEHVEPPVAHGLKTCAHALQWIYDHAIQEARNGKA